MLLVPSENLTEENFGDEIPLNSETGNIISSDQATFLEANLFLIKDANGGFLDAEFAAYQRVAINGAEGRSVAEGIGRKITVYVGSMLPGSLVFPVICVASLIFGLTMLSETKNRYLEEIASSWTK